MLLKLCPLLKTFCSSKVNLKTPILLQRKCCSVVPTEKFDKICLQNETVLQYEPGSEELCNLEQAIECIQKQCAEIPIVIGESEETSSDVRYQVMPHRHAHKIAKFYHANKDQIKRGIDAAVAAQEKWDRTTLSHRIKIWERAAELMAKDYRAELVAATMLGQSKTIIQAEIDAAVELIDFTRMNAGYLKEATNYQPITENEDVTKNHFRFRGIEGFVAAISPFNFTAIGGNLAYTPALMGNGVVWKPSDCAMLSSWHIFNIFREAGVPDGLINFIPADGPTFGSNITDSRRLAGINFTGSVGVFKELWYGVAKNLFDIKSFPRLIGECGGKNYHFVHKSANVDAVVAGTIRSAFEYSGQKCSACSRLYVPASLWESKIKQPLVEKTSKLIVGDVCDYQCFLSAVIDAKAFERIVRYIDYAKSCQYCNTICGGNYASLKGYYIQPTIIECTNPEHHFFKEEMFGPVLCVYVYKDADIEKTIKLVTNMPYALTGSVYAQDEAFLKKALINFKDSAGNFYINDKSTGSVVGQQPFGGGRNSGTNDKAGSPHYILRWTSPQSIKETFVPQKRIYYPYMDMEE